MTSVRVPGTGAKTYIDPIGDHGAAGNAKTSLAATILAGSLNTVTVSDSSPFTAGDVGKTIGIPYAGVIDATKTVPKTHVTTIATYVNSTTVTLTTPAVNPVSPATHPNGDGYQFIVWGADDTTALRNACAAASAARKPVHLGLGKYLTTDQIFPADYLTIIGEGRYDSVIYPAGSGTFSTFRYDGSAVGAPPLVALTFKDFEIDGHGLANSTYTTITKGMFIVNFQEMLLENMFIHHTPATSFGNDQPIDSEWINCWSDHGGRQVNELGGSAGGSGLGIGCGRNEYESLLVSGGGAKNCGKYGLFIENQTTSNPLPKGYRVVGFVADSCKVGLSENGTQGAVFDGCQAYRCAEAGFQVTKAFTDRFGRDAQFSDCVALYNAQGLQINSGDGQVRWDGGQIGFGTGNGVQLDDTSTTANTPPHPTNIAITDARIFENGGRGIRIISGSFDRVTIEGCRIWNSGSGRPAIGVERPVNRLEITNSRAWDDRATKLQSYGLDTTGATITELVYGGNDFRGNLTGKDLIPGGTVTTNTSILGGNL